jgi:hypothetical protein
LARVFALEAFVAGTMAQLANNGITAICDEVICSEAPKASLLEFVVAINSRGGVHS